MSKTIALSYSSLKNLNCRPLRIAHSDYILTILTKVHIQSTFVFISCLISHEAVSICVCDYDITLFWLKNNLHWLVQLVQHVDVNGLFLSFPHWPLAFFFMLNSFPCWCHPFNFIVAVRLYSVCLFCKNFCHTIILLLNCLYKQLNNLCSWYGWSLNFTSLFLMTWHFV